MKENVYQIISPKLQSWKDYGVDLQQAFSDQEVLAALAEADRRYLHWEDLRHKSWIPKQFRSKKEAFWTLLRLVRHSNSIKTPIRDKHGDFFTINTKNYNEFLHVIDKEMAGNFMGIPHLSEANKKQFIARSIIEESIASSQLEGANTSRAVAKKMLIEGRRPVNNSEQMIVNNHQAMLKIEENYYKQDLSLDLLSELHRVITHKTLSEEKQGRLRETLDENGEPLKVIPWPNTVTYIAPDKTFVEAELSRLIDFANDKKTGEDNFIHPLIKGIMLHFWVGLLHPFEDGNGRLARILFYWYMLRHEYWAFKYLSLSEKIKKSSKQYAMAYVYSEQDRCDLTYFIHYSIEKLKLARKDFQSYIKRKVSENRVVASGKQEKYGLNERQIKLLHYFNQEMEERTNLTAYQQLYLVKKLTAINDLKDLVEKGFLLKKKMGRNTYYYPTKLVTKFFNG